MGGNGTAEGLETARTATDSTTATAGKVPIHGGGLATKSAMDTIRSTAEEAKERVLATAKETREKPETIGTEFPKLLAEDEASVRNRGPTYDSADNLPRNARSTSESADESVEKRAGGNGADDKVAKKGGGVAEWIKNHTGFANDNVQGEEEMPKSVDEVPISLEEAEVTRARRSEIEQARGSTLKEQTAAPKGAKVETSPGNESEWIAGKSGGAVGRGSVTELAENARESLKDQAGQASESVQGQAGISLSNPSGYSSGKAASTHDGNPAQERFPKSSQKSFVIAEELVSDILETLTRDPNWTMRSTTATETGRASQNYKSETSQTGESNESIKEKAREIARELGIPVPDFNDESFNQAEKRIQPVRSLVPVVENGVPAEVTGSVEDRAAALVAELRLPDSSTSASNNHSQSGNVLDQSRVPTEDSSSSTKAREESDQSFAACMTEAQDAVL